MYVILRKIALEKEMCHVMLFCDAIPEKKGKKPSTCEEKRDVTHKNNALFLMMHIKCNAMKTVSEKKENQNVLPPTRMGTKKVKGVISL